LTFSKPTPPRYALSSAWGVVYRAVIHLNLRRLMRGPIHGTNASGLVKGPQTFEEQKPNDHLRLVFDNETTTDMRQDLRFGMARLYSFGKLVRTFVFHEKVTAEELETIRRWAADHNAIFLTREQFVMREFLPLALDQRAVVAGFNLPFDLSRLAVDFAPKVKVKATDAWTLCLISKDNPRFPYTPPIRIEHLDNKKSFIHFGGTRGKHRSYRGCFVDLKTLTAALTGQGHSLKSAGETFGCDLKKTTADYGGPVTVKFLDYCLNDVALTAELYDRAVARYKEFNLPDHPSRILSAASLGKATFRAQGAVAPIFADQRIVGRLMASFFAGKVEDRVAAREVKDVGILDYTSQYSTNYVLLGAERFRTAQRFEPRNTAEEVRVFLERTTVGDLLKRETWLDPLMWTVCEVEARGELLPIRSTYSDNGDNPTIGWNHITTQEGLTLAYLVPDLLAAKFLGGSRGRAPKIVSAQTFDPVGKQMLKAIKILGTEVGPNDDLIQRLSEARILLKREKPEGWKARSTGIKQLINTASYGDAIEVNVERHNGDMEICGLEAEDSFHEDGAKLEAGGEFYDPLIGTMIASAGHLLLALLEAVVTNLGGEMVAMDTDSGFITPSEILPAVAAKFQGLNPYDIPCDILKDETPPHSGPVSFFGLSSKRYALFERKKKNGVIHILKASDHGLGAYQVPTDREKWTAEVWERLIRFSEDDQLGIAEDVGEGYHDVPATGEFALTKPSLWPRVKHIDGMRPFTFLTLLYQDSSSFSDNKNHTAEFLSFIAPKDVGWSDLARRPHARTWGNILWNFERHRDRKHIIGKDGRIIRRDVFVRRKNLIGIGKEGAKMGLRIQLGKSANAEPTLFVDWRGRLREAGRADARALGLPWRFLARTKRKLKDGTLKSNGAAVRRLKQALVGGRFAPR
jgi:hypothetical protein